MVADGFIVEISGLNNSLWPRIDVHKSATGELDGNDSKDFTATRVDALACISVCMRAEWLGSYGALSFFLQLFSGMVVFPPTSLL